MPCPPAVLVALLPLWIQATAASAQMQFSEDWSHGKRSAPAAPASLVSLLGELGWEGTAGVAPPSGPRSTRRLCAVDDAVLRQVFDTILVGLRTANVSGACVV